MARQCKGTNRAGEPCKAPPLKDSDYCSAHSPELPTGVQKFGSPEQGAEPRRKGSLARRKPSFAEVQRQLVEENVEKFLRPHLSSLGLELVDGEIRERDTGGVKLYGVSKDGEVRVSDRDDLSAQIQASEKVLDRVFGKARQATEISGPDGAPVQVASTFDLSKLTLDERRQLLELAEKAASK